MPDKKVPYKEEKEEQSESASPVCYVNSPELRPEFKKESNKTINDQAGNDAKKE